MNILHERPNLVNFKNHREPKKISSEPEKINSILNRVLAGLQLKKPNPGHTPDKQKILKKKLNRS